MNESDGGLLILSRHNEQSVVITLPDGRTIDVYVLEIKKKRVRLRFRGPKDVRIDRSEVARLRAKQRQKEALPATVAE